MSCFWLLAINLLIFVSEFPDEKSCKPKWKKSVKSKVLSVHRAAGNVRPVEDGVQGVTG
jgi:hypothetical protein